MKKIILLALVCVLAPLAGRAQTAVSGNLKDVGVANASGSNTYVRFTLLDYGAQIPKITNLSGNLIFNPIKDFKPDANGIISGTIQGNDTITPPATKYQVCVYYQGAVFRCNTYIINGPTFNLNTATPLNTSVQVGANQLVVLSYPFTQATPASTWTIPHNFNDPNSYVQVFDTVHRIIYPDRVDTSDPNNAVLTFVTPTSGFAIAMHAGAINIATNQLNAIISNPVGAQVVGPQPFLVQGPASFTNTLTLTNPGDFTNTAMHNYDIANVGNVNFLTEVQFDQTTANFATESFTVGLATPSGATQHQLGGIGSYVTSACNSLGRTTCNTVAGYFHARATANGAGVWAHNPVVSDAAGTTNTNLVGGECDVIVHGSPQYISCYDAIICAGCGSDTTAGTAPSLTRAFHTARAGNIQWFDALATDRGSISSSGVNLDGHAGTANTRSDWITFHGYDGGNAEKLTHVFGDATGDLQFNTADGWGYFLLNSGGGLQMPAFGGGPGAVKLQPPSTSSFLIYTLPATSGTILSTGNGAGNLIQTARVASCSTAAPVNSVCSTTVTWTNPFADANYTVSCSLVNANQAQAGITHVSGAPIAASVSVEISNFSVATAASGTLHCTAVHD